MRTLTRVIATVIVGGLGLVCADLALSSQAEASHVLPAPPPADWLPPVWHPGREDLLVMPAMEARGEANIKGLRSSSVFVYDLDSGEVLHERAADYRRPVASLTKLVSALAMASAEGDLGAVHCIDARFYPTRSGARSRFSTGECYGAVDFLGAALVSSDNRAAYGLAVLSGLEYDRFIQRMDLVSAELGMQQSTWADPSGLEDENLSTARDMARAAVAVAAHPQLSIAATAPSWDLLKADGERNRELYTTNRLLGRGDLEVLSGKTGYTDTAHYCFAGVLRTRSGRRVAVATLGASRSRDRWSDLNRIVRAVEAG